MLAGSGSAIHLRALLEAHRNAQLACEPHKLLDARAVRPLCDYDRIQRPFCLERFANGVDSGQPVHLYVFLRFRWEAAGAQRSSVATACAAIASPRPIASTDSFVFAFKLIMDGATFKDFASASRIAG